MKYYSISLANLNHIFMTKSNTNTEFLDQIYQDADLLESIKIQSFLLDIAIKVKQLRKKKGV